MNDIILVRLESTDQGTFGRLIVNRTGWSCATAELPWRDNARNRSCIPAGKYECDYLESSASGKYRKVYHVKDVPDRSGILIHAGNLAGDVEKGYKSDVDGCILLGTARGMLGTQYAVLSSKDAVKEFAIQLGRKPATLWIIDDTEVLS